MLSKGRWIGAGRKYARYTAGGQFSLGADDEMDFARGVYRHGFKRRFMAVVATGHWVSPISESLDGGRADGRSTSGDSTVSGTCAFGLGAS